MSKDGFEGSGLEGQVTGSGASLFEEAGSEDSFLRQVLIAEPKHRLPEPGERLGGLDGRRYSVLEWMGSGGMGQVFRARDEVLHREVALKFLLSHSGQEEAALREARAVARLDHENIVRIFDVSEWHGTPGGRGIPFLVMECLEGESLATLLERGRLEVWRALDILEGITAGLAHAHERHLVHRDLKPNNVLLTRQGGVKLLDFGLSHLTLASASAGGVPHLLTSGTPAYMAPEQWRGEPQDARTDVWAAGVVLHEMLTGALPCLGATFVEMRGRVLSPEPVPPVRARRPEVPRRVEALLSTLLAKDPARRFRSALELREELRDVRARLGVGKAPRAASPERRQVTLVTLLLEGPTGNDTRLDAEDVGELETAFQETCAELITRHGGTVAWAMGGEVLACFGLPLGREDDSERAVRAGLQVLLGLPDTLGHKLPHLSLSGLSVRGGIHTDLVAVGTRAFQGDAPKVAAWLARQARPGGLVLGDTSWKRVRGAFDTEPLGERVFESLAGTVPMNVHRVVREREVASRFDRARGAGPLWPLVGREPELDGLLSLWDGARRGRGAFVLVSGEAGIGKSRLIQELCERVAPASPLLLRVQCWPRFSAHTAPPALELLQDVARFDLEESPSQRLRTLEARLRAMGLATEDAHLVGNLLTLPVPEDSPILQRTPEWCKERTFEALAHILLYRARHEAPLLLVLEDLHWADSIRLEFLGFLLERVERARLLVVLSARSEFRPSWPGRPWLHRRALERLPAGLAATLVKEVARERVLPEETVQRLVSRTDGIPLFIEEMTRMVLEGGAEASIPVTLHELLLARLDLLPSRQKALAQLCAVVGREFSHALLAAVSGHEEAILRRELAGLMDAGLLRERGTDGSAYQFRHALIQDAAYQSLSRSTRRQYHQRIARVLVERFPGLVEEKPEVLAYHCTEAGEHARAIGYWERAGQHALLRQAGPEALGHLTRALELLPVLEGTEQRLHAELRIRMPLGIAAMQVHGIRAPETERMYGRIHELILRVGEALPRLDLSFWGLFAYYYVRADLQRMYELAQRLLDLGQRHGHRVLRVLGCRMSATALYAWGRPVEAMAYLERALAVSEFTLEEHRALAAHHWIEPMAGVLAYGSLVCAVRGRMEESRRWAREALTLARRVGHPHTLTHTRVIVALTFSLHRDAAETLTLAEQAISSAYESNIRVWLAWAELLRGWALSELGWAREGFVLVQRELSGLSMRLIQAALPRDLSLLAEVHLKLGECQEALAVVDDALVQSAATGERNVDAWLHDLRGECLRRLGREEEAERSFLRALAVARQQGAGLFELRATMSLCRQLRDQGRGRVACRLLSRAYARFQGGGDSVDLQEARLLLEDLQAGGGGCVPSPPGPRTESGRAGSLQASWKPGRLSS